MYHREEILPPVINTYNTNAIVSPSFSKPPPCLTNKSDIVYVNGIISFSKTLQKCVEN